MAGYYPEELIAEITAANDIVDTVSRYVRLKRSGNSYMGCCPFHREKTPSFHVSADKQLYHCFGCGAGGSVIQFIMNAEGLDFPEAVKYLADKAGIRLPEDNVGANSEERYRRKQELYKLNRDAARFFREMLLSKQGAQAQAYLTRRGLSGKTIAAFGLGFAPKGWDELLQRMTKMGYSRDLLAESGLCIRNEKGHMYDRFRERVMYPIIDVRGNIIGFGGRIMSGDGAKYMNSPESIVYDKGKNLFALNLARKSKRGYYILVEGYMDVISLHQAGIDAAVAGCGTALTEHQARLISKSPVYLCYDSDEAGIKACVRAESMFRAIGGKVKVITIPHCKDADEYIKKFGGEAFEKLIEKARSFVEYQLDILLSGADLNDVSQKIEIVERAAKIFAGIPNAVEREAYINTLSVRTGISVDSINSEVRKINGKNARKEISSELKRVSALPGDVKTRSQGRRISAESGFLSMLADSARVFGQFGSRLSEDDFSVPIHKKIFAAIREFYESGRQGNCSDYLVPLFRENEKELSEVLLSAPNIENPIEAAADFAEIIENEIFEEKLRKAQNDGDIALIAQLLKEKKGGR
mgnify:FL=1